MVEDACKNKFDPWLDISIQYSESYEKINNYITRNKEDILEDVSKKVELEIASGIKSDMTEMVRKTKQLTIYEYAALSQSDIITAGLTNRQKEVALLRKCYSFEDIANKLKISQKTAFATYKQAVRKIEKYKKLNSLQIPIGLSPQQSEIYNLYYIEGYKPAAIAEKLNTSHATIKEQLKRIKSKTKRGTKQ